jgi:large subunit ribosomal protein L10
MTRKNKILVIDELYEKISSIDAFYIADSSQLNVEEVNKLRRTCFESNVEFRVAKNTLIKKALERNDSVNYSDLFDSLKGPTTIIFSEVANLPAKIIKDYRKNNGNTQRPILKAACVEGAVFVGNDQLDMLATLKSKNELIGEVIGLLQSPAKNVIGALQSSGQKLAGILKTLSER